MLRSIGREEAPGFAEPEAWGNSTPTEDLTGKTPPVARQAQGASASGKPRRQKHGHTTDRERTPTYVSWSCMLSRCRNPKDYVRSQRH
jgi:hypothetical protein